MMKNHAEDGGAIHAIESKLHVYKVFIANNTASNTGGGLYRYQSELNFPKFSGILNLSGNSAAEKGLGFMPLAQLL